MRNVEVLSFATDVALAQAAAARWLERVKTTARQSRHCVALSGGRVAHRLFEAITAQVRAQDVSLERVHFFWGDERCVRPSDPESNFNAANELLLKPLQIPLSNYHRLRGEEAEPLALSQAEAELCRLAPLNEAGQPILDVIFLGMGEDGHVASLFPGESDAVMADLSVVRAVTAVKPPPRRLTVGYGVITAAREVWVLASGAGKEAALTKSLTEPEATPLARVIGQRQQTVIFTDIPLPAKAQR